jgi:hypothetical protein
MAFLSWQAKVFLMLQLAQQISRWPDHVLIPTDFQAFPQEHIHGTKYFCASRITKTERMTMERILEVLQLPTRGIRHQYIIHEKVQKGINDKTNGHQINGTFICSTRTDAVK